MTRPHDARGTAAWRAAIEELRVGLVGVFEALIAHAQADGAALDAPSSDGGWTAREVLEHVALTDRFLLVLADKLAERSERRAARGAAWPAHGPRFEHLRVLATRELAWTAPAHMVPREGPSGEELVRRLAGDRDGALALLARAPEGLGTLHRIRMSVVGGNDDRLDLYQYLEVLRLHAVRHLAQLARG